MSVMLPFNRPCTIGADAAYVREAIASGHMCGDGPFGKRAQALLEAKFGAPRALLTTSCTAALEMSALLCDLAPGDEVILPSYTFVSTANAIALRVFSLGRTGQGIAAFKKQKEAGGPLSGIASISRGCSTQEHLSDPTVNEKQATDYKSDCH